MKSEKWNVERSSTQGLKGRNLLTLGVVPGSGCSPGIIRTPA